MKKILCIISFLVIAPHIWSQKSSTENSIEIIYVKAYKNFKDKSNSDPQIFKDLEYQLLCNQTESRFEYISKMQNDGNKSNLRFIGKGGGKGVYYKNLQEKIKISQKKSIDEKVYLVKEKFDMYDWKLLKESKEILGYTCYKALGRHQSYNNFKKTNVTLNIIAWYAPTIPIPFGPAGHDGLPGLVLESSTSSFYFIASNIKFLKKDLDIKRPVKGKEILLEDYKKKIYESFLNFTKT